MASVKDNSKLMEKVTNHSIKAGAPASLSNIMQSINIKQKFEQVLGKRANGFISSLISVANSNSMLKNADPMTVMAAGMKAAVLNLPIESNLGFAYVVPYRDNKANVVNAQFQMGYKGFIQLAMRTGQYKTINACEIYEGEIGKINRFTGEFEEGNRISDKVVGYLAYFELVNGFEKYFYMTVEEVTKHGKKYSKSFSTGLWKTDFHAMAIKTVLKLLLSKYGVLSIDMQTGMAEALQADGAVIKVDGEGHEELDYGSADVIQEGEKVIDAKTGEILEPKPIEMSEDDKILEQSLDGMK